MEMWETSLKKALQRERRDQGKRIADLEARIAVLERELDHWSSGEWREVLAQED